MGGDVWPDGEELVDTDGDGVPDFLDDNSDNDGLDDSAELEIGTSRTDVDTDGDTFSDHEEVMAGTNPLDSTDHP